MKRPDIIRLALILLSCAGRSKTEIANELKSLDLTRGDIALCGAAEGKFGKVQFGLACSPDVQENFNLATALQEQPPGNRCGRVIYQPAIGRSRVYFGSMALYPISRAIGPSSFPRNLCTAIGASD